MTIAGATTATTGSSVTYTVSSTDTTADDLSGFTLDFGDGSTPVTAAASESLSDGIYTASVSFTHDYATPGTYVVTASASDSLGTTPAENSISVAASAPAAPGLDTPQIIVSGPTSAIVGTPVTYTATITNPTGNDGLTAGVFTIGDGSFTAPGTETDVNGVWTTTMTETYTYQNPSAGGDMVTFSAFDSFGEVAASNGVNTIVAAIPPTVTISGPTTATVGSLVTYTVLSTDTTADELSGFSMNFGDGSTSVPITASETLSNGVYTASATFTHDYATPGNYVVTASASDSLGTTPAQKQRQCCGQRADGARARRSARHRLRSHLGDRRHAGHLHGNRHQSRRQRWFNRRLLHHRRGQLRRHRNRNGNRRHVDLHDDNNFHLPESFRPRRTGDVHRRRFVRRGRRLRWDQHDRRGQYVRGNFAGCNAPCRRDDGQFRRRVQRSGEFRLRLHEVCATSPSRRLWNRATATATAARSTCTSQ